jgi:hypothetical protein
VQEATTSTRQCSTLGQSVTRTGSVDALLRLMFLAPGRLLPLVVLSVALTVPAIWAVLSVPVVYSREMTWDLMFNLDGAWRIYTGQTAHVDFHDPVGTLPFAVTALGFYLVGTKPFAFVVGECIVAAVITALAVVAVKDRLALVPGLLFVTLCAILALVPITIGDLPTAYTFAMAYNRFGWSLLGVLYLVLFVEPGDGRRSGLPDIVIAAVIMVALYYLKITYFGVAYAAVGLGLLTCRHMRQSYAAWCVALGVITLIAIAPFNHGYIADIVDAISAGSVRTQGALFLRNFAYGGAEQSSVIAANLVLLYLWLQGRVNVGSLVAGCFVLVSGLFLISQNAQDQGIPLYVIPALLISVAICDWVRSVRSDQPRPAIALIGATLSPLVLFVFYANVTLMGYHWKARQTSGAFVVSHTNLQGLAVPLDPDNVIADFATGRYSPALFGRLRNLRVRYELSQYEYVQTILELAELLRARGAADASVVVIDQVNPLPFAMGARAPRWGNLWWAEGIAWRAPGETFGEAGYVAIPHFPTQSTVVHDALIHYRQHLATEFAPWLESRYWTVLKRQSGRLTSSN